MKKIITVAVAALLSPLLFFAVTAYGADNSHSKLTHFFDAQGVPGDGSNINGSSAKLTRGDGVVWIRVNTKDLPPGTYTNWWIIFNNPDACAGGPGGCAGTDFANPAVEGGVLFATGGVVNSNGIGHFSAHLEELETRDDPNQRGGVFAPLKAGGAQDSEIHYVIKYHGPASWDPVIFEKQITTINGGCAPGPFQPPDPDGDFLFPCYDPQGTPLPFP